MVLLVAFLIPQSRKQHFLLAHTIWRKTQDDTLRNCPPRRLTRDSRALSQKSSKWSLWCTKNSQKYKVAILLFEDSQRRYVLMQEDVWFLCLKCNRHKTHTCKCSALTQIYKVEPFERVAINIVNLLPCTHRCNQYILTVVDHFTKHVEAYALPNQETVTIARVFLNKYILRFGDAYITHTDKSANIKSNMFKELF